MVETIDTSIDGIDMTSLLRIMLRHLPKIQATRIEETYMATFKVTLFDSVLIYSQY